MRNEFPALDSQQKYAVTGLFVNRRSLPDFVRNAAGATWTNGSR
jgi:hypothetical protein